MLYLKALSRNTTRLFKGSQAVVYHGGEGIPLRSGSEPQLLDHGDVIMLSPTVSVEVSYEAVPKSSECLNPLQLHEAKIFESRYTISPRLLGIGAYGKVYMARESSSQRQVACKVVDFHRFSRAAMHEAVSDLEAQHGEISDACEESLKVELRSRWRECLTKKIKQGQEEVMIQAELSHPNIARLEAVFFSEHTAYIMQELISGGDLFSYIESHGTPELEDAECAVIIKQLLEAVNYIHSKDIVHRDIKPENILIASWQRGGRVVLTDFGFAKRIGAPATGSSVPLKRGRMHTMVGTIGYSAPEVRLDRHFDPSGDGYTSAVDLWSIGAITALLFTNQTINSLFPRVSNASDSSRQQDYLESSANIGGTILDFDDHLLTQIPASSPPERLRSASLPGENLHMSSASASTAFYDLTSIDDGQHEVWGRISSSPKDFIKQLLVHDEVKRMNAEEALNHRWLTKRYYKDILDAVYCRAIKDWKPTDQVCIQQITAKHGRLSPLEDESVLQAVINGCKSRHF
ncbi:hypothetical protein CAC42_625 [Sphaceloma murrayae]|uniref:Protein kinase domain-containing protein n=1 Tax=Sphaceloma murrayae TaxID=2082308 RepID=A0A2K1QJQ1_9PEZI|nr:hypothetical protein CAC42_625 [Sphaceloma murrayae]